MTTKYKPCPFCASAAKNVGGWTRDMKVDAVTCSKDGCIASFKSVSPEVWNTRPGEVAHVSSGVNPNRICPKLESACGNDSWGWCQVCPNRTAEQKSDDDAVTKGELWAHVHAYVSAYGDLLSHPKSDNYRRRAHEANKELDEVIDRIFPEKT